KLLAPRPTSIVERVFAAVRPVSLQVRSDLFFRGYTSLLKPSGTFATSPHNLLRSLATFLIQSQLTSITLQSSLNAYHRVFQTLPRDVNLARSTKIVARFSQRRSHTSDRHQSPGKEIAFSRAHFRLLPPAPYFRSAEHPTSHVPNTR
ncbi:hypothetical protein Ahia01_001216700, partial [Argonauta hians]